MQSSLEQDGVTASCRRVIYYRPRTQIGGPNMTRWIIAGLLSASFLATGAMADAVRNPACSRDLGNADVLLHGIRLRENSVARGDFAGLCRVLRRHLHAMTEARRLMFP